MERLALKPALDLRSPADAVYAYYALYHPEERTKIALHHADDGAVAGFVAVCQTGQRLFQPTVVLRTADVHVVAPLLERTLEPGRPYYIITTPDLRPALASKMESTRIAVSHVYSIDLARFEPTINVLVVREASRGPAPRFSIRAGEDAVAQAGLNWLSPQFAELFVWTRPAARGRGWGRSVISAATTWAIHSGRRPLYVADVKNPESLAFAKAIGYVDTGVRELVIDGVWRGAEDA
jgi:RimJ/RimL family protein N-acetyltransferase